jgi:hypothetical protein
MNNESTQTEVTHIDAPSDSQLRDISRALLENQAKLNAKSYDTRWVKNAKEGVFDYPLASGFEIIELGNSWNRWNWWRNTKPTHFDLINMRVEAVDALHFILSDILVQYDEDLQEAELACGTVLSYVQKGMQTIPSEEHEVRYVSNQLKELLVYAGRPHPGTKSEAINALASLYRLAIVGCQIGFGSLAAMYFAKSTLNGFRKENGYGKKQYIKIWGQDEVNGSFEDNYVLMNWVSKQNPPPKVAQMHAFLTEEYAKVVEAARETEATSTGLVKRT